MVTLSELQRLAEKVVHGERVPGVAVAVVDGARVIATAAAGSADLATRSPMTLDASCNWFSITKIATATAVVLLSERGSLDLDAPVSTVLGDRWPDRFSSVRVRHLLSHSSGLRNPIPIRWVHRVDGQRQDPATLLDRLLSKQRRPRFEPGTKASYSNVGYLVLGEMIAAATGSAFESFIRNELLAPLGMKHTGFSWAEPGVAATGRVTGYQRLPRALTPLLAMLLPRGVLGARTGGLVALEPFEVDGAAYGGLIGPVTDAARLLAMHANRGSVDGVTFLRPESVDAMTLVTTPGEPYDVGLGWFRPHDHSQRVEHLGGGMGYWNVLRLDPQSHRGIAVMSNITRHWDITSFADTVLTATER